MGAIHQALLAIGTGDNGLGPEVEFMTAMTPGSLRNNFGSSLGFRFTVGASSMHITALGRWRYSGNSGSHLIRIIQDDAPKTLIASATIDMSTGTVDAFKYVAITPVILAVSTPYIVASAESDGGDQWGDDNISGISTQPDGTINFSVYEPSIGIWQSNNTGVRSYIPPNFKYRLVL